MLLKNSTVLVRACTAREQENGLISLSFSHKTIMEARHRETRRLLLEARGQLEALESASLNPELSPEASSMVSSSFRSNLSELSLHSTALRQLLGSEPASRREVWRARLRDLDDQIGELSAGDRRCTARFQKIREDAAVRTDLFRRAGAAPGDAVLGLGPPVDEMRSLDRSTNTASGILETGQNAMAALLEQRKKLKSAKTRMLDVLNKIGLDRRIISQIERRDQADIILLYSLMALVLIVLFLAYLWKSSRKR